MTDKTPAEMLDALGKPFPRTAIKQRKGGGGKSLSYVETHTVIHRLNTATNGDWSFHIKDVQWRNDVLMVQGELTIPGLGTRSGFGVQQVVERAGEDLVKGAASDALKKCATLFGVALELYGADYEANVSVQAPQRPADGPKPAHATPDTHAPRDNGADRAMKRAHAVAAKHGITHEGLRQIAQMKARRNGVEIASLSEATPDLLNEIADGIEAKPNDTKSWLTKQAELLPGVALTTAGNPDRFTN